MGMFSVLMGKIFHGAANAERPADAAPTGSNGAPVVPHIAPGLSPTVGATPATSGAAPVDVEAILDGLASSHSEKLDWKHSIVDLMKLVGMDSSITARKELAADLHFTGDTNDSAAMNIWLHKEVMQQLAANGGKVPASLLSH